MVRVRVEVIGPFAPSSSPPSLSEAKLDQGATMHNRRTTVPSAWGPRA